MTIESLVRHLSGWPEAIAEIDVAGLLTAYCEGSYESHTLPMESGA